ALCLSRMRATFVMSTLWTVVTCADVRWLSSMCSAMRMRIVLIGSTRDLACVAGGKDGTEGAGDGGKGMAGRCGAAPVGCGGACGGGAAGRGGAPGCGAAAPRCAR